jgi:uncharacterized protein DUF6907
MTAPALAVFTDSPEWRAHAEDLLEKERLFDVTRPACPGDWCNGECEKNLHFGTSITHVSDETTVACTPDTRDPSGDAAIRLWVWRDDNLGEPSKSLATLNFTDADLLDDNVSLTAAQCRALAAELLRHADLIDPEPGVPVTDVHVGDWLPVDDEWFRIYGINVDEPTDSVQLYTTVDWDTLPEYGGDEEPHEFDINDTVRVRRDACTTSKELAQDAALNPLADRGEKR